MKSSILFRIGVTLLLIPSIFTLFFPGKIVIVSSLCLYPILVWMFRNIWNIDQREFDDKRIIALYILMNLIIFIRALFDSRSQQDFTVLFSNTIFLTLVYPLFMFFAQRKYVINIFSAFIYIALPLCTVAFFCKFGEGAMMLQKNLSFIFVFVFLIPYIKRKWKFIILIICILLTVCDLTRRSTLINVSVCLIILILYYLIPISIFKKVSKFLFWILIISPIIFLSLGLSGIYNIFTIGDSFGEIIISSNSNQRNLMVDSRTSIYMDVFSELARQNTFVFGLGGSGKTKTSLTDNSAGDYDKIYKEGRRGTESGMLNYFQWSGIIGAFCYWLLLASASYKAIFKSNNSFFLMLGLFMAFKVLYSFIEDILEPNASTFYIMISIGLCYNYKLRSMNNREMRNVIKLRFRKSLRYARYYSASPNYSIIKR